RTLHLRILARDARAAHLLLWTGRLLAHQPACGRRVHRGDLPAPAHSYHPGLHDAGGGPRAAQAATGWANDSSGDPSRWTERTPAPAPARYHLPGLTHWPPGRARRFRRRPALAPAELG